MQHCNSSLQRCCTVAAQDWALLRGAHTGHCLLSHVEAGAHLVLHAGLPGPGLVPGHGGLVCVTVRPVSRTLLLRTLALVRHCWCQPRPARRGWCAALRSCTELQLSRCHGAPSHRAHGHAEHVTRRPAAKYSGAAAGRWSADSWVVVVVTSAVSGPDCPPPCSPSPRPLLELVHTPVCWRLVPDPVE